MATLKAIIVTKIVVVMPCTSLLKMSVYRSLVRN